MATDGQRSFETWSDCLNSSRTLASRSDERAQRNKRVRRKFDHLMPMFGYSVSSLRAHNVSRTPDFRKLFCFMSSDCFCLCNFTFGTGN